MTDIIERVDRAIVGEIARQMREGPRVDYSLVARAALEAATIGIRGVGDTNSVLHYQAEIEKALSPVRVTRTY